MDITRTRCLILATTLAALAALGCATAAKPAPTARAAAGAAPAAELHQDFEGADALRGWDHQGDVAVDAAQGFRSARSLRLSRTLERVDDATSAATPAIAVAPGAWLASGAVASDLYSPDVSYDAIVQVEWAGADGKAIASTEVANVSGKRAWQPFRKQALAPAGAATARLRIALDKTHGVCHVDDLALVFVPGAAPEPELIERFTYASPSFCNLIEPSRKPVITTTVAALKPLAADQRRLTWQLRDYWGAEIGPGGALTLEDAGADARGRASYRAVIDLSGAGLERGKYYELVTRVDLPGAEPAQDRTTLAIVPEAESRKHPPQDIPFTSRNWDNRFPEHPTLSDRIGLRVMGLRGEMPVETPDRITMTNVESAERLGMLMLAGLPTHAIENHLPGYEQWTEDKIRVATRALLEGYAKRGLRYISLGNEPPGLEERCRETLPFYKAEYEEVKRFDPSIQVIGTSVGACEAYFKAGFQDYLDAFDFHVYEDTVALRNTFAEYHRLFAKYHCEKPIVCTEIGLNSQGLPRLAIARDLVRKLSVFFALGGTQVSWFDLFYPDPDGTITGTNGDSFNAFTCKYLCYSPRLDAIAYYDMVNGILVKKCVGEKLYANGVLATLFKDDHDACFMTLYSDQGRHDVFLPLPGAGAVTLTRIDGGSATLDAGQRGLTLGVDQDPLLLSWQGGATTLPESLGAPAATVVAAPAGVVKGGAAELTLALDGIAPESIAIHAPFGWTVGPAVAGAVDGKSTATWTVRAPAVTGAREGRLAIALGTTGEIDVGIPVTGVISMRVLPTARTGDDSAGVALAIRNNGAEKQRVTAALSLLGEYREAKNTYDPSHPTPTTAFFAEVPEATLEVEPGAERVFPVPLGGIDRQTIYRVRAVATDQGGIALTRERMLAGFATAPRAKAAPSLDGVLDEADWSRCQPLEIDEERQFWGYGDRAWRGAKDLSGEMRLLWDDQYLYVGVTVVDDVFRNQKQGAEIWAGDGLQFLIDPCRESPDKIGKYDYSIGVGAKGPQTWCTYSADPRAPSGEAKDIRIATRMAGDGTGAMTYEVAIPWTRLAPFAPEVGRDLGLAMILNDDDGKGRDCYMGWFGGVSSKEVDLVGDLLLGE